MFMVKEEFVNIKKLLKVKVKIERRAILISSTVVVAIFLLSLASTVFEILQSDAPGLLYFTVMDFSTTFLFGFIFMYIILMFMYRKINNVLSVFPQTNNSRFITTQIVNYSTMIVVGLCALVFYLLYYGVISFLSAFNSNIHLVIDFDIGFVFIGFFIYLVYAFLLIALIDLIGAILRKWKLYAAVVLTVLMLLLIINMMSNVVYTPMVLNFLIGEPSIILFILKAVATWLVIVTASLLINRYTIYHQNKEPIKTKKVVIIFTAIVVLIFILLPLRLNYTTEMVVENHPFYEFIDDFIPEALEKRIDISHLPRGSNLTLVTGENINKDASAGGEETIIRGSRPAFVNGRDALTNIQSDTLIIEFKPPFFQVNGFDLTGYMNPMLKAHLVDDTLYIDYTIEKARVVIMPIWGNVRQFDAFRERGLFTEHFIGHSFAGNVTPNIFISVE